MNSLEQREFIARIISCLTCSTSSFWNFKDLLEREERRCINQGKKLAIINPSIPEMEKQTP